MTHETITTLSPAEVLTEAREFFTGRHPICPASIESESDSHITFNTFRSRITVAAFPDPGGEAPTRVRVSTLREDSVAARFVSAIRSAGGAGARAGSVSGG